MSGTPPRPARGAALREVALTFLRIGATAFGGPAAHIAIMRHELVERRRWVSEQHFLDLLGATNLIPGPNSSEMAMHLGLARAGQWGLLVAGSCFVLPAMLIVLGLAWAYTAYGTTPAAGWLLYGIKPVIIPLIVLALSKLGRAAVKNWLTAAVGLVTLALFFAGINFVILLLGGGLVVMAVQNGLRGRVGAAVLPLPLIAPGTAAAGGGTAVSAWTLFWVCLKIGGLLYGSGYVLFALLQAELVDARGWITQQQLLDAIAVGQVTPGPLSTSLTFIGYLLGGAPVGVLATVGFYIPAFVIVALSNPLIPRIRRSAWAGAFLDGVNVAALGLMAAVTWELGRAALVDLYTALIALAAGALLLRYQAGSVWLVAFGALMGLLSALG